MVLGQDQSRNVLIALIVVAGATLWWAFSRSATSARQGWLVTAIGILNGLFLLLAVGLMGAAGIRVFGEGYAVFGEPGMRWLRPHLPGRADAAE